jgi:hypothetical protein
MLTFLSTPPAPGNLLHFIVTPGLYPDSGPLVFPPGTFSPLSGYSLDAMMLFLTPAGGFLYITNVDRVTF